MQRSSSSTRMHGSRENAFDQPPRFAEDDWRGRCRLDGAQRLRASPKPSARRVTSYNLTPPDWTPGLKLRLAVLADLHVCEPWMSVERLEVIVEQTNSLGADAILLLGDYVVGQRLGKYSGRVSNGAWATRSGQTQGAAWRPCRSRQSRLVGIRATCRSERAGPTPAGLALQAVGIPVYENNAVRLEKDGQAFWLAGLGDQWAFWPRDDEYDEFVQRRQSRLSRRR